MRPQNYGALMYTLYSKNSGSHYIYKVSLESMKLTPRYFIRNSPQELMSLISKLSKLNLRKIEMRICSLSSASLEWRIISMPIRQLKKWKGKLNMIKLCKRNKMKKNKKIDIKLYRRYCNFSSHKRKLTKMIIRKSLSPSKNSTTWSLTYPCRVVSVVSYILKRICFIWSTHSKSRKRNAFKEKLNHKVHSTPSMCSCHPT
jgi:hypothetical protein